MAYDPIPDELTRSEVCFPCTQRAVCVMWPDNHRPCHERGPKPTDRRRDEPKVEPGTRAWARINPFLVCCPWCYAAVATQHQPAHTEWHFPKETL